VALRIIEERAVLTGKMAGEAKAQGRHHVARTLAEHRTEYQQQAGVTTGQPRRRPLTPNLINALTVSPRRERAYRSSHCCNGIANLSDPERNEASGLSQHSDDYGVWATLVIQPRSRKLEPGRLGAGRPGGDCNGGERGC
jgi:hypothetical protein